MKLYVSFDMEGISGIVDWDQCTGGGAAYQMGIGLTLAEVNAAIEGAMSVGVDEVVVNDSHWKMANLNPEALAGHATYITGSHKPAYMMQGLDDTFDAIFFIGYHGSISGEPSVLSHTYSPATFTHVALNGVEVGESGINALVAMGYGVPVALITGDRPAGEQAARVLPGIEQVVVKESITRMAATNLHPERARELVREGARRAIEALPRLTPPRISLPVTLTLSFQTADQAEISTWIKGVTRLDYRTTEIVGDDPIQVYRSFVGVCYLTRQVGGR